MFSTGRNEGVRGVGWSLSVCVGDFFIFRGRGRNVDVEFFY